MMQSQKQQQLVAAVLGAVILAGTTAAHPVKLANISEIVAPTRALPWSDWNFICTTDTHGWQAGHGSHYQSDYSGNWADFAVFVKGMKRLARNKGVELFVVDSGDTHDGTSLSDNVGADKVDGYYTQPLMQKVDYDVLTVGNHELYKNVVAQNVHDEFAPFWGNKYLSSNSYIRDSANASNWVPIGQKYRAFIGSQGTHAVAFGFVFNFTGQTDTVTNNHVNAVTLEVQQPWFTDVLTDKSADVYIVAGHIPLRQSFGKLDLNTELLAIVAAIRAVKPTTPIVIFGGHSHIRDFATFGPNVYGIEAGRFMETVGFLSLSKSGTVDRRYLDANVVTYNYHLGNQLNYDLAKNTHVGEEISAIIEDAKAATNYSVALGCAPQDYYLNRVPITNPGSLYYFLEENLQSIVQDVTQTNPVYVIINAGSQRTDLFAGKVTVDDALAVSPFTDHFVVIRNQPLSLIKQLEPILEGNVDSRRRRDTAPACDGTYGYVTSDSLGPDGDDTAHCVIPYVSVNVENIYSPKVLPDSSNTNWDIVMLDYIARDVVSAVNGLLPPGSQSFVANNVKNDYYSGASFTTQDIWTRIATKNWPCTA